MEVFAAMDPAQVRALPAQLSARAVEDRAATAALVALLTNLTYVAARLRADRGNPGPLEADYARAAMVLPPGEARAVVVAFGVALRRESHAVRADPAACYPQLHNRLWRGDGGLIDQALAASPGAPVTPWLRAARPVPVPHPALGRTLTGHDKMVTGGGVSADGRWAVSSSEDGTLRVWDLAGGVPRAVLRGHTARVRGAALSADGQRAVSAGEDGVLCVWDLAAILAGEAHSESGDEQPAWRLATFVNYDGLHAVSLGQAGDLQVWRIGSGWPLPHPKAIVSVEIEGTSATYPTPIRLMGRAAGPGATEGAPPAYTGGRTYMVPMVALTPDGRWAVAGHEHDKLVVWDLEAGAPVALLKGHSNWVQAAAITADGRRVVSGGWDGTVRVWDLPEATSPRIPPISRKQAKRLDRKIPFSTNTHGVPTRILTGHSGSVNWVAVTADGRRVVSTGYDRTLRVWDLAAPAGQEGPVRVFAAMVDRRAALALSADGRLALVSAGAGLLRLLDLDMPDALVAPGVLLPHSGVTRTLALTPDGRVALAGDADHTVRVWDLAALAAPETPAPGGGAADWRQARAVTADGRWAAGWDSAGQLWVWDSTAPAGGTLERALLAGEADSYPVLALAADGRRVVSGSRQDGLLRVWALAAPAATEIPPIILPGHSEVVADLPNRRPPGLGLYDRKDVNALAITPDGRRAVSGGGDFTVRVWDLAGAAPPIVLSDLTQSVWALAVSADGQRIVSGGNDETVRVWDLGTAPGPGLWPLVLAGHAAWVLAVALTPDGRWAVSGSDDQTVRVWDLGAPTGPGVAAVLHGHTAAVRAVGLSADGRRAVSGGEDGTLRVWDVAQGAEIARYTWDAPIAYCALAPGGVVTARDGGGQVLIFTLVEPAL